MTISTAIFKPHSNYTISASSTSSNTALTQVTPVEGVTANAGGNTILHIYNATGAVAYFTWGKSAQTATNAGFAIAPGAIETVDMGVPATNLGCILEAGATAGSVYVSLGSGA